MPSTTRSYLCVCEHGYTGRLCDVDLRANSLPLRMATSLKERARAKFALSNADGGAPTGSGSSSGGDSCLTERCKNNGTCMMAYSAFDRHKLEFVCNCAAGFKGALCEKPVGKNRHMLRYGTIAMPFVTASTLKTTAAAAAAATSTLSEPCKLDKRLCQKQPHGNASFVCVKSRVTQDYTLCLSRRSMRCESPNVNPCLNNGVCYDASASSSGWKCACQPGFVGELCETQLCSPTIHKLIANHVACQPDASTATQAPNIERRSVSDTDMQLILEAHNQVRRQVTPSAADMQLMYWDVRLEQLAQKRSQLCTVNNSGILTRQLPGYGVIVGENMAAGYETWSHVLRSWTSESAHFVYKSTAASDNQHTGHYTQVDFHFVLPCSTK